MCGVGVSLRTTEKHRNIVYRAIIDDWYIYCRFSVKLRPESVDGLMIFESCSTMFVSLSHQYLMFILFIGNNPFQHLLCVFAEANDSVIGVNNSKRTVKSMCHNDNLFF